MKKKLISVLAMLVFIGLTFVACTESTPSEPSPLPSPEPIPAEAEVPIEEEAPETSEYPGEDDYGLALDYDAVIQSLAGMWDWPGSLGNTLYIFHDGTWEQVPGDVGLYGNVYIMESNGTFSLEFIVTHAESPGAFGWIPPGETSPAAGTEYGWRSGDVWGRGVYSPASSELHLENWDGSMLLMERNR